MWYEISIYCIAMNLRWEIRCKGAAAPMRHRKN
jgi:hypothetical protein